MATIVEVVLIFTQNSSEVISSTSEVKSTLVLMIFSKVSIIFISPHDMATDPKPCLGWTQAITQLSLPEQYKYVMNVGYNTLLGILPVITKHESDLLPGMIW